MHHRHSRNRLVRYLTIGAVGIALVWTLFPFWWAAAMSIKRPPDFFTARALPFLQFDPTLDNWRAEWQWFDDPAGMGRALTNSLLIAVISSALSLLLGGLAAYGVMLRTRAGKLPWRFLVLVLMPRLMPPVIVAVPYSRMMALLGLGDTRLALILAHTTLALPWTVLILFSAMMDLPRDILDAAQMEGCSQLAIFRRIVAPLMLPASLATAALCLAQSWNEFPFALMNVQQRVHTAPLAIAGLITKDGIEFTFVGSHIVLVILPPLILAIVARRYIVRGLSLGTLRD
jgi:multiple sugar transport system permease protein